MDQYFISPKRHGIYSRPLARSEIFELFAEWRPVSRSDIYYWVSVLRLVLHGVMHMIRKIMGWPSGVCIDVKLSLCFCVSEGPVDSKGHISNQKVNALTVYIVYVSLDNLVLFAFMFITEHTKNCKKYYRID